MGTRWMAAVALAAGAALAQDSPPVVEPGPRSCDPPADAVVLFDGKDASQWAHADGRPAEWPVVAGALVSRSGTGDIYSKRRFGSAQIHLEFAVPDMPQATDQAKGNSGVYLQGRYEIQVLDSWRNPTYPDGSAAALYGQYPPLVNASRPPGEWQTYDIVFHAARCDEAGRVTAPGTLTLFHNGILVQDHVAIKGPTGGADSAAECEPGPLRLQDHTHPDVKETSVKFRNIWYRALNP